MQVRPVVKCIHILLPFVLKLQLLRLKYILWFKLSFGAKLLKLFQFYFPLSCIHYHNLEQWQMKLKPVQKTRINLNHNQG